MKPSKTNRVRQGLCPATPSMALLVLLWGNQACLAETPPGKSLENVSVSVTLDQGSVDVKSTQGPLGLYREQATKAQPQDFEAFKRQMSEGVRKEKQAFEKYKEQITREFVGYVESVTLKPGTELAISGNTAVERQAPAQGNAAHEFMKRWRAEGDSPIPAR